MKAKEIGDSYRLMKTSMGTTIHVVELRTGTYPEEFEHYILAACHSGEVAKELAEKATQLFEQAFSRIVKPPWNTNPDGARMQEYNRAVSSADKKLKEAYLDMFPVLREYTDIFQIDGELVFSVYEVPIV